MGVPANIPALMMAAGGVFSHSFDTSLWWIGTLDPLTSAYTCASDATLLVLSIEASVNSGARLGGAPTYNGVAMTQAGATLTSPTKIRNVELWYLLAPSAGASYNIEVPNSTGEEIVVSASSYISSSGASAFDVEAGATGISALITATITPTEDGCVIVESSSGDSGTPVTANNQTLLSNVDEGGWSAMAQYALSDTTDPLTFTWTTVSDSWATQLASFKPV